MRCRWEPQQQLGLAAAMNQWLNKTAAVIRHQKHLTLLVPKLRDTKAKATPTIRDSVGIKHHHAMLNEVSKLASL